MRIRRFLQALLIALFLSAPPLAAAEDLLENGDFEKSLAGWSKFWSRDANGGSAAIDTQQRHGGQQAVRVEHKGSNDWSLSQVRRLDVKAGEIYELTGWVRVAGEGNATLCVILYDAKGEAKHWSFGGRTSRTTPDWRQLKSRFVIPRDGATMVPRLIGVGPATVWFDDAELRRVGSLAEMRPSGLPATLTARNKTLDVTLTTADATFAVKDQRTGRTWTQRAEQALHVLDAKAVDAGFDLQLLDAAGLLKLTAKVRLEKELPEVTVELGAEGELASRVAFPAAFVTAPGMTLILPVNEGISYPVDDKTLRPMEYYLYGGHGLCMGWWGVTDGPRAALAIVETPDDAVVRIPRIDGLLCAQPEWLPQKGQFGPARRIRYVFFDEGGYVAMCKRYRQHAKQIGLFKTLAEKREKIPAVDLLVGAVNVWCWDRDPVPICREMQAAGIDRILWSNRATPEQLEELNSLNVLTSRYDIYQDTMNPENFSKLYGKHGDWTTEAWANKDIMRNEHGDWIRGWEVKGKDGKWYPCGVLCDRQAVEYAKRRIPAELQTHPYRCRFIDTTTASPWRECYDPNHPVTRTESRHWKMELLRYISEGCGLVTGSETGHEAAVPYTHYFEGMLSLGPYRVPDSGRDMATLVDEVPERVAKFQTGHFYRLPLWELVYHDCLVAQWYWGDYNNKLPKLWDRRDLFNALYGTPPMFMFRRDFWQSHRDRFVQSYRTAATVARATGYSEMLSHRWLTEDHAVQQTRFAGGITVTVNFGEKAFAMPDGRALGPLAVRVDGGPAGYAGADRR